MPEAFKPVLRREMEVYAGFLEFTDHHVGRIFEMLKKLNILEDTLAYYIHSRQGDARPGDGGAALPAQGITDALGGGGN